MEHVNEAALSEVVRKGPLHGEGTVLSSERIAALVHALPVVKGRRTWPHAIHLQRAHISGPHIELHTQRFNNSVSLDQAQFDGELALINCHFERQASAVGATFNEDVTLSECWFETLDCRRATFRRTTRLDSELHSFFAEGAVFEGFTSFLFLRCESNMVLANARFANQASFLGCEVKGDINLENATFEDVVSFNKARCRKLDCKSVRFEEGGDLGTFNSDSWTDFRDAVFSGPLTMRLRTHNLDLRRVTFGGGGTVLVEGPFVAFSGAVVQRPLTLARTDLGRSQKDPVQPATRPMPRLGALMSADVTGLTIDGFDLSLTRFVGAHNLDSLRLSGDYQLPISSNRWGRRRQTISDEHRLRSHEGEQDWRLAEAPVESEPLDLPTPPPSRFMPTPKASDVAAAYRALRKGKEDARDAAGASDFYVGEMEMRRRAGPDPLISAYRLVSSYGTNWWRPLLLYVTVIALATVLAHEESIGFVAPQTWWRTLSFTLASTLYVAHAPEQGLRTGGELLQFLLRLFGPIFIGLSLLALRARVKR